MKKQIILILLLVGFIACTNSTDKKHPNNKVVISDTIQTVELTDSTIYKCDYLGEIPPRNEPKIFAPDIITLKNAFHIIIAFHPNGKEIYWLAFNTENINTAKINYVEFDGKNWSKPKILNLVDDYGVYTLHIAPNGNRLFFTSKMPSSEMPNNNLKLWYCEREGIKWSIPKNLPQNINNVRGGVSSTLNGTLYTDGIKKSTKNNDEYSDWEEISTILDVGKSTGGNPFISPEEDYILFGKEIPSKMYISFKTINGQWTNPLNLNEEMNLKTASSQPIVSPDGKYLFYYVNDDKHIHWVSTNKIKELQFKLVKKVTKNYF